MTRLQITSERIDDVPLLIHFLSQMHIDTIIDEAVGPVHGNRAGLSAGTMAVVFIAYILTECNHFLSPVREWVAQRRQALEVSLGATIGETDFTDDRLASVLDLLGKDDVGEGVERALGQHLIRAYALPARTARIDTTSVSLYHDPAGESILRFGHSKDHRPDLRQFKQVLGTLDPAGVPLYSATVEGNRADDPLYLPAWRQMVTVVGRADFLVVGDSKMAALATRAQIAREGGFYLAPLPETGHVPELLRRLVLSPSTSPIEIRLPGTAESEPRVGLAFEVGAEPEWLDPDAKQTYTWSERVVASRSDALAAKQQQGLLERLEKAEAAVRGLRVKDGAQPEELEARCETVLATHRVGEYLSVRWRARQTETKHYLKRGRHGPDSPFESVTTTTFTPVLTRRQEQIEQFNACAGWRLFATNAAAERLSLPGVVACYREQWQPERGFHRLKGGALAIRPLLLKPEVRIRGLLRILVMALQALTLFEYVARRSLETESASVAGLYDGNPKRTTQRPTTERLLKAFDPLTLYRVSDGKTTWFEVTPLTPLQEHILSLVGLPTSIYALAHDLQLAGP